MCEFKSGLPTYFYFTLFDFFLVMPTFSFTFSEKKKNIHPNSVHFFLIGPVVTPDGKGCMIFVISRAYLAGLNGLKD